MRLAPPPVTSAPRRLKEEARARRCQNQSPHLTSFLYPLGMPFHWIRFNILTNTLAEGLNFIKWEAYVRMTCAGGGWLVLSLLDIIALGDFPPFNVTPAPRRTNGQDAYSVKSSPLRVVVTRQVSRYSSRRPTWSFSRPTRV